MGHRTLSRFQSGLAAAAVALPLSAVAASPPSESPTAAIEQRAAALEKSNDLAGAAAAMRDAVAGRKAAGEFSEAAEDLERLARIEQRRGDLDASEAAWREFLGLPEKNGPEFNGGAAGWNGLATIAYLRGNLDEADALFGKALAIERESAPEGLDEARTTGNLGLVAFEHGDYERANDLYNRALRMYTKIEPEGLYAASPLNYLGVLAKTRGDFDSAEQYYERALAIFERLRPGGIEVAGMENNLGVLCELRRDYDCAERHHRAALDIRRRLAPDGLDVAASLNNLAEIALDRNETDAAKPLLEEALAIKEKLAPGSPIVATTLVNLGEYDLKKGEPKRALAAARRSLEIRRRFEPASLDEAQSYELVARAERVGGDPDQAAADLLQALDSVEGQRRRLGGDEPERAAFSSRTIGYYREAAELLHSRGRDAEAFAVLERSRARELLALCGRTDLKVDSSVPPDLLKERSRLDFLYDRAQARIGRIDPERNAAAFEQARARLLEIREQRAGVEERIWASSPRLRDLESPRTLTLAQVRRSLDRGTAVLEFCVGETSSLLFAIPADPRQPLRVVEIPVEASRLETDVEVFRNLIRQERDDPSAQPLREAQGLLLYRELLAPASEIVAKSRRLLICPDASLHLLPFAALTVERGGSRRYLAEWRPMHVALSATLATGLAQRRSRRPPPALQLAAFGDPDLPPGSTAGSSARGALSVAERARRLGPLPEAREEVESIGKLFPDSRAVFTEAEASESRARTTIGRARYVHFACHAVLDSRFPVDSALVLSAPAADRLGGENGLLQVREIYENVRLRADLVVLSACETALGRESGGEGLVGLVRAFEFAGARSVLASLWNISDRSTPELMTAFYRGIRGWLPMDRALRAAQIRLLHGGGAASRPFFWAAFELQGDWR